MVPLPQYSMYPALNRVFAMSGLKGLEGCLCFSLSNVQFVLSFSAFKPFEQESFTINVSTVKKNNGKIIVEIYNSKSS